MATAEQRAVTFGIKTSQAGVAYDDVLAIWREADGLAVFEHAWLWDHLVPLRGDVRGAALEAWTLLAALAGQTERLRLGVVVTSNRIRPPAVLAKMAATVDRISHGRLVFGIGAGGSRVADPQGLAMVRREYDAYGVDVVSPGEAVSALGEACTLIRRLWTEDEPFDFAGRCYRLSGAICEPKPVQRPHPPFLIGAAGPRALRVVARHADVWNCPAWTAEEFRGMNRRLDEVCAEAGRDPREIERSKQLLVPRDGAAEARDQLLELAEAGCTHFVLAPLPPWTPGTATWLAEEVVQPVLAELPRGRPTQDT